MTIPRLYCPLLQRKGAFRRERGEAMSATSWNSCCLKTWGWDGEPWGGGKKTELIETVAPRADVSQCPCEPLVGPPRMASSLKRSRARARYPASLSAGSFSPTVCRLDRPLPPTGWEIKIAEPPPCASWRALLKAATQKPSPRRNPSKSCGGSAPKVVSHLSDAGRQATVVGTSWHRALELRLRRD